MKIVLILFCHLCQPELVTYKNWELHAIKKMLEKFKAGCSWNTSFILDKTHQFSFLKELMILDSV